MSIGANLDIAKTKRGEQIVFDAEVDAMRITSAKILERKGSTSQSSFYVQLPDY